MQHWATRILLLCYVVAWFGAVLPGHTRGVVRLDGIEKDGTSCCPAEALPRGGGCHGEPDDRSREPGRPSECAVCVIAGVLQTADVPLTLDPHHVCQIEPIEAPATVDVAAIPLPIDARGPPRA